MQTIKTSVLNKSSDQFLFESGHCSMDEQQQENIKISNLNNLWEWKVSNDPFPL